MKKFLFIVLCAAFVWAGLVLWLISATSDIPAHQTLFGVLAALSLGLAIFFAGVGNSLKWKDKE